MNAKALLAVVLLTSTASAERWPCIPENLKIGEVRPNVEPKYLHCFRCPQGVIWVQRFSLAGPSIVRCVRPNEIPLR